MEVFFVVCVPKGVPRCLFWDLFIKNTKCRLLLISFFFLRSRRPKGFFFFIYRKSNHTIMRQKKEIYVQYKQKLHVTNDKSETKKKKKITARVLELHNCEHFFYFFLLKLYNFFFIAVFWTTATPFDCNYNSFLRSNLLLTFISCFHL